MKPAPLDPAGYPASGVPVVNLPNALTMLRLLAVPVLAYLLVQDAEGVALARVLAAAVFIGASITDLLDGAIARRRGQVTTFGKIADPIADKALTGTALIGLSVLGDLPWWVTIVILGREIAVTVLRFWVIEHGVIPASRGGKVKTVAQIVAISMVLIALPVPGWSVLCWIAILLAVVLTLVTGVDYWLRAQRLRRLPKGASSLDGAVR